MTKDLLTEAELSALRALDTPTVCNAIELVVPERRAYGFTTQNLFCLRPELGSIVGYARTATVRAYRPSNDSPAEQRERRFGYLDYLENGPRPSVSVVQDLDDGQAGHGCFWGEVNSNIHRALGCIGTVTNGGIRDLGEFAEGFQAIAAAVTPSHGFIHVVDFGTEVNVAGMVAYPDDVVHADRHGAVAMPIGVARDVPAAADLMARRERVVLDAANAPGANAASIKQAMIESGKIKE